MRDCNDIFETSCNPAFIAINQKLDRLMTDVCLGNGKPSLKERVSVLEATAHPPRPDHQQDQGDEQDTRRCVAPKRIAFGPLKIDGYNASDAGKIALGLAFGVMMWLHWQGLQERSRLAQEAEHDRKTLTVRVSELTQLVAGRAQ